MRRCGQGDLWRQGSAAETGLYASDNTAAFDGASFPLLESTCRSVSNRSRLRTPLAIIGLGYRAGMALLMIMITDAMGVSRSDAVLSRECSSRLDSPSQTPHKPVEQDDGMLPVIVLGVILAGWV